MRRILRALALGGLVLALPASAHDSKRTDKCGCHHQFGLRHCHPKKKTQRCEAPVKAVQPRPGPRTEPVKL